MGSTATKYNGSTAVTSQPVARIVYTNYSSLQCLTLFPIKFFTSDFHHPNLWEKFTERIEFLRTK